MKCKKLVALGLSIMFLVSGLTACGAVENNETSAAVESKETSAVVESKETSAVVESNEEDKTVTFPLDETVTFTVHSLMNGQYKLSDTLVIQESTKNANIVFDFVSEVNLSEYQEKGNLLMASGNYPDLLLKGALDCNKYGMEGILIPLEDLIREYAPNLTALLDECDGWSAITAADGHVYSMPRVQQPAIQGSQYAYINKKWLENLGLPEPTNADELYAVLKAFKEKDANGNGDPNDEIPMTAYDSLGLYTHYLNIGVLDRSKNMGIIDGEYVFYPTTEEYKNEFLAFFAKCYEEGLIDEQTFTQNEDQFTAKAVSSDVYGVFHKAGIINAVGEERAENYTNLQPEVADFIPKYAGVKAGGLAITDKCEHPEIAVAWADYFYTYEGSLMAYFGVEGVTYEIDEEGYYNFIDPDNMPRDSFSLFGHTPQPALIPAEKDWVNPKTNPAQAYVNSELNKWNEENPGTFLPIVTLTEEENKRISDLSVDIGSYVASYVADVVTGVKSLDATWDEFCKTLDAMGVEEYEKIYQEAYARSN